MRWLVTALLMPAVCSAEAADPPSPPDCRLKQYGSIDLTLSDEILLPVSIDGRQTTRP
jgi:hypothetical protein